MPRVQRQRRASGRIVNARELRAAAGAGVAVTSQSGKSSSDRELVVAYERLSAHSGLVGSHVSLDRDRRGNESVNIVPDWIEAKPLAHILEVARELELDVALTGDGLRLAAFTDGLTRGVADVKRTLAGEAEDDA